LHLSILTLAGDYPESYTYSEKPEEMGGIGFWGTILPDFGFPDKKMANILNDTWPADDFDRGQVYDLYKWYATGITKGQKPFDVDSSNNPIYSWVKNNSPYTDEKINHWFAVFKRGIHENWISGDQVGTALAPEHEGTKISNSIKRAASLGTDLTKDLKWILGGATALIIAFYAMPLILKGVKTKRKFTRAKRRRRG